MARSFVIALLFALLALPAAARAGEPEIRVKKDGDILEVPLEHYVLGVLTKEVSESWPLEALKAQAVASRTYALRRLRDARAKGQDFDVTSDTSHQVFDDGKVAAGSPYREAVRATLAEGVCFENEPVEAAFFSTCGGHTEDAEGIWSKAVPYLKRVTCKWCVESPNYFWTLEYQEDEFLAKLSRLGAKGREIKEVVAKGREGSGRVDALDLLTDAGRFEVTGKDLREALGAVNLKSLTFQVRLSEGWVKLLGSGAGHGVGMCQWGAKGQAEEGRSYREILAYYYAGTHPCRLYK